MDYRDTNDIRRHLLGGNSTFALLSAKTGVRISYRVIEIRDSKPEAYLVYVSTMERDVYVGTITTYGVLKLKQTAKSKVSLTSNTWVALSFLLQNINTGVIHKGLEYLPSRDCCVCGRLLKDPESLKRGVGPECLKKI